MFVQNAKQRLLQAQKNKQEIEKNILRVLLSEIETTELQKKKSVSDRDCHNIVHKLISVNNGVIEQAKTINNTKLVEKLTQENEVLNSLVPKLWTEEQIIQFLTDKNLIEKIKEMKEDGPAIGIAMKNLNAENAPIQGEMVKEVIKKIRSL